jgi:hypothetical protein
MCRGVLLWNLVDGIELVGLINPEAIWLFYDPVTSLGVYLALGSVHQQDYFTRGTKRGASFTPVGNDVGLVLMFEQEAFYFYGPGFDGLDVFHGVALYEAHYKPRTPRGKFWTFLRVYSYF